MIDLDAVLDWVNEKRAERGLPTLAELPKGQRSISCNCPIALSLTPGNGLIASTLPSGTNIYDDYDAVSPYRETINHPAEIKRFVNDFDAGLYPELVAA